MEELRMRLSLVADTYEDFVTGVLSVAREYDMVRQILDYMDANPLASSSEILGYIFRDGIEYISEENQQIVVAM